MNKLIMLITAINIVAYWQDANTSKQAYLGDELFPAEKQIGLELRYIKGVGGLPVALNPAEFDADYKYRDKTGVTEIKTDMPLFREAVKLGEKERQDLMTLTAAGNQSAIDVIVKNVYNGQSQLIEGARAAIEQARMQVLAYGNIAVSQAGVTLAYDYGASAGQKEALLGTAKWSDTVNSDPMYDIERWQINREAATGVKPTRAMCTRTTFNYLRNNVKIKTALEKLLRPLTDKNIADYILEVLNLEIVIYNKLFKPTASAAAKTLFPDNIFTLLPGGEAIGKTVYGTTPEEADLMSGNAGAGVSVSIANTGISVTTIVHNKVPVNIETIVSQIALPSAENLDKVFMATVA